MRQKKFDKLIPIGLSVSAVVVAGLVAWIMITVFSSKPFPESEGLGNAQSEPPPSAPISSIIGTVLSVSGDTLTIEASPAQNPQLSSVQTFDVQMDSSTSIVVSEIPKSISPSVENPSSLFKSKIVKAYELEVGEVVNVRLGKEFDPAQNFVAQSIEVTRYRD